MLPSVKRIKSEVQGSRGMVYSSQLFSFCKFPHTVYVRLDLTSFSIIHCRLNVARIPFHCDGPYLSTQDRKAVRPPSQIGYHLGLDRAKLSKTECHPSFLGELTHATVVRYKQLNINKLSSTNRLFTQFLNLIINTTSRLPTQ